jgi:hypothetical protein
MIVVAIVGLALILLALTSRLLGLWLYRRVIASPTRDVEPSSIPGAPWLRVESDARATQMLFKATYAAFPIGTLLVIVGVLFS